MQLFMKNVGKIKDASIEINGITVIAGENGSGKSTIGKTLFAVFNSLYDIDNKVKRERLRGVTDSFRRMDYFERMEIMIYPFIDEENLAREIVNNLDIYKNDKSLLYKKFREFIQQNEEEYDDAEDDIMLERVMDILQVSDEMLLLAVANRQFNDEFHGQINNIFSEEESKIDIKIKDNTTSLEILDNKLVRIETEVKLKCEAIYIDDPFVIDEIGYFDLRKKRRFFKNHKDNLLTKLSLSDDVKVINEIITDGKLDEIYKKINTVCNGDVIRGNRQIPGYKNNKTDKILDIRNLSSGLKTFVILKTLLKNGTLQENGTIILDEPEIHLHPEWQLLFAELIVLIQKEFGMHILLNTHSPYFLNAIEVYSAKHNILEKCKYYLAYNENEYAYITDVSDNTEKIYSKLAQPFQTLENESFDYD